LGIWQAVIVRAFFFVVIRAHRAIVRCRGVRKLSLTDSSRALVLEIPR
jgi:hypothetical protein